MQIKTVVVAWMKDRLYSRQLCVPETIKKLPNSTF